MPPKEKYSCNDVVDAAFEIVKKEGMQALSARKIAERMKASVAPVYSHFESIEDLKYKLLKRAKDELIDYTRHPYTERVFLNIGVGIVLFARDECRLYRALFMDNCESKTIVNEFLDVCRAQMQKDPRFDRMPDSGRDALLMKMWIFTHGLAAQTCVGLIEDDSEAAIIQSLEEVGALCVGDALKHNP